MPAPSIEGLDGELSILDPRLQGFGIPLREESHGLGLLQQAGGILEVFPSRNGCPSDVDQKAIEDGSVPFELRSEVPPCTDDERETLSLFENEEPHGHALDTARRQTGRNFLPEKR